MTSAESAIAGRMDDLQETEEAIRNGAIMGFIIATLGHASSFLTALFGEFNPWWIFLDSGYYALFAGVSFYVLRKSRSAALLLFLWFAIIHLYPILEVGLDWNLGVPLIVLYFFGGAVQGSFAYHRIRRDEDRVIS